MRHQLLYSFAILFFIFQSCSNTKSKDEIAFYVSQNGSDSENGTSINTAFATLEKARNTIRELKKNGELNRPITVYITGGTYQLANPFVLAADDSGSEEFPIIYTNYNNERPIISGGLKVDEWKKTEFNGHKVLVADLSKIKGYAPFEQLWVNSHRAIQARTPNNGYLKVSMSKKKNIKTSKSSMANEISFAPADEHYFQGVNDGVAVVFYKWLNFHMPIERIDSKNKKIVSTKVSGKSYRTSSRKLTQNDSYYLEGGSTMLDKPGEWYLDREDKKLYYFPLEGESKVVATIPSLISVIRLEGNSSKKQFVKHIQFKNLSFRYTTWKLAREVEESCYEQADIQMNGAIVLKDAKNCLFENCEVTAIGNYGIEISVGCSDNQILKCDIHDLGAGGFLIGSKNSPKKKVDANGIGGKYPPVLEKPSDATHNNEIADCRIYNGGKYYHSAVGIWIGQSPNNHIHHNEIYNFYYSGISTGWTWGYGKALATGNIFEYNHIHHIGKLTNGDGPVLSDLGGIYSLGNQTGSIIRNNEFHDIWAGKYGGWAIYLDEGSSNMLVENNLVYRSRHACFNQHYGKDNLIRNNIFAFADACVAMLGKAEKHTAFILKNNILLSNGTPIYAGGYAYNIEKRRGFVADSNLVWSTVGTVLGAYNLSPSQIYDPKKAGMSWKRWKTLGNDRHSIIADPGFKDPENGDFSLPADSPALKIGFKPFPLGQAGPRK